MRTLIALTLLLATRAAAEPAPSCVADAPAYDRAALRAQIAALAAPGLDGRATGEPGDAAARALIADRMRCLGLTPAGDDGGFAEPFTTDGRATANVVATVAGSDPALADEVIAVSAHHDHLGDGHLGANDDASGVAGLLAIAQAIRQHGAPRRTIAFLAFGGEELGERGSAYFARHARALFDRVVYDVNLDMIGSYRGAGAVYAMGTFPALAGTAIMTDLARTHRGLKIGLGGRGADSDHEAFCQAGVPYVFFWTPDKRCYHARCDTIDHLDDAHAAQIAEVAGALVERLGNADHLARVPHACAR
ncbi:MAG TPA: M20/M25/M40 family metallo-hydrolase [Kofleriaceae bacterium]|nr:M20/M25/M40 family metallo-hydrolase [Kofleriaceae bacterium]